MTDTKCRHLAASCTKRTVLEPGVIGGVSSVTTCGDCGAETREYEEYPSMLPKWGTNDG